MELSTIIGIVTVFVTYILGIIAKKNPNINNKLIPLQNLLIGLISACVYFLITKDWNTAIAGVGLFTGGLYDLGKNAKKLLIEEVDEDSEEFNDNFDDMEE